jgi:hypothetical protein
MGFPVLVCPVAPAGLQNAPGVTYPESLGGGAGASVGGGGGWCVAGGGWCVAGGGAGASVVVTGGSVVVVVVSVVVGVVLLVAVLVVAVLVVVVPVVVAVVVMVATTGWVPGCCAGAVAPNNPVRITSTVTPPPNDVSSRDHTGVRHHQRANAEGAGSAGTVMRDE